jgi:hypothetical protein
MLLLRLNAQREPRVRLALDRTSPEQLRELLHFVLVKAGAPKPLTPPELLTTLCHHAQGNLRALMNMASKLLAVAAQHEAPQLDEQLFFETYASPAAAAPPKVAARRR